MIRQLASTVLVLAALPAGAAELYADFPDAFRAGERYVVYSHGLIVEGDDPRPVHPQFGAYEFPEITAALFAGGGFNLVAHHRPANTDFGAYVARLESWVRSALAAGVPPERITLVGFSRGAQLTAAASSRLREVGINTALMAVCLDGGFDREPPLRLGGRLLSIYETSDVVGSCEGLAADSELASFEEIAISTGKSHGAFYEPLPEWMLPLKRWIDETNH